MNNEQPDVTGETELNNEQQNVIGETELSFGTAGKKFTHKVFATSKMKRPCTIERDFLERQKASLYFATKVIKL